MCSYVIAKVIPHIQVCDVDRGYELNLLASKWQLQVGDGLVGRSPTFAYNLAELKIRLRPTSDGREAEVIIH